MTASTGGSDAGGACAAPGAGGCSVGSEEAFGACANGEPWRCRLFIIQPSPFCNLACDYCYLPTRKSDRSRLTEATLVRMFERLFEARLARNQVTVVWHAGEPLAVPVSWYRAAWARIRPLVPVGLRVDESFQTNGTLIDDAWCDWFVENRSFVGVSVDGPAAINDRHRKTRSGRGSLERILRGVRTLTRRGIDFQVISVLTWDSLEYPDELYEFYVANGIRSVGFNIDEQEGANAVSTLGREDVSDAFRRFLERFLHRVAREPGRLQVRELDGALRALMCPPPPGVEPYNDQFHPFAIIALGYEGSFTTFSPEFLGVEGGPAGTFTLGNVHREGFLEVARGERFQALQREILAGADACRAGCDYWRWCGGGAPINKLTETGSLRSTETLFCRLTRKAVIDVVLAHLERVAADRAGVSPR